MKPSTGAPGTGFRHEKNSNPDCAAGGPSRDSQRRAVRPTGPWRSDNRREKNGNPGVMGQPSQSPPSSTNPSLPTPEPYLSLQRRNEMLHLHNSQNHARRLACLMLAMALLTGVAAHTGYSSTQTPKTIHKREGSTSKQMQTPVTSTRQNGKIAFVRAQDGKEEI